MARIRQCCSPQSNLHSFVFGGWPVSWWFSLVLLLLVTCYLIKCLISWGQIITLIQKLCLCHGPSNIHLAWMGGDKNITELLGDTFFYIIIITSSYACYAHVGFCGGANQLPSASELIVNWLRLQYLSSVDAIQ